MSTVIWILGGFVVLVGTHAFAYWRGAVAGEIKARAQANEIVEWAEREGQELKDDVADGVRNLLYRLRGRFNL